jgi:hypothetical protein
MTGFHERPCGSCRQVLTDDPSGLCEDCQADVLSNRPGSITEAQREALVGLFMDQGMVPSGHADDAGAPRRRAQFIAAVVPGWTWNGDLGVLSQQQAGDVLEALEERRLSQEARGQ